MPLRTSQFSGDESAELQRSVQDAQRANDAKPWARARSRFVTLTAGVVSIQHGLKRKPAGWLLHSAIGPASVYVATAPNDQTIEITATAVGSCVLEVW